MWLTEKRKQGTSRTRIKCAKYVATLWVAAEKKNPIKILRLNKNKIYSWKANRLWTVLEIKQSFSKQHLEFHADMAVKKCKSRKKPVLSCYYYKTSFCDLTFQVTYFKVNISIIIANEGHSARYLASQDVYDVNQRAGFVMLMNRDAECAGT